MSVLTAELQGEIFHIRRVASSNRTTGAGMVTAKVKSVRKDGEVLLEANQTVYRLRLDGASSGSVRAGSKLVLRRTDLPQSLSGKGDALPAGLKKIASSPWGTLRMGKDMADLIETASKSGADTKDRLFAVKGMIVDIDGSDLAGQLKRFVPRSGAFYENELARMLTEDGSLDPEGLSSDLKNRLINLKNTAARTNDEKTARAAGKVIKRITSHQLTARADVLSSSWSVEVPYWDGRKVKSLDLITRSPRDGEGPFSLTIILREGELGLVQINIMADRGSLEVNVSAEMDGSADRLSARSGELLAALKEAGWRIGGINVRRRDRTMVDFEA